MSYCSLHTHSDGSLLDGLSTPEEIAVWTANAGQAAVALTDHGNLMMSLKFSEACMEAGVKPILGCEVYVAEGGIDVREREMTRHLILLAENNVGWRNLVTLVSRASTEGMFYKPRVDRTMLREHSEGLICLSACLGGELAQKIMKFPLQVAIQTARDYDSIFPGRYFLELQHHGTRDDETVKAGTLQIARETGLPLVATQDSHYTHESEADLHDTMLCLQTHAKKSDPVKDYDDPDSKGRFGFSGGPYNLLREEEMMAKLGMYPDAISNSGVIAEMCTASITTGHALLPEFNVPADWVDPYV